MLTPENFIMMPIPASQYTAVCALLGGAAMIAVGSSGAGAPSTGNAGSTETDAKPVTVDASGNSGTQESGASAGTGETATNTASPSDGEIDAHGHPWNPDLHAGTKGKTKDGLWRMKVGVTRPDPKPGFPVDNGGQSADTGTSTATDTPSATSQTATEPASAPAATSAPETAEDDEFAAFRAAASASDQVDASAAAAAPTARQWSDADLGALCNQAAVKLGDPAPIKEIIGQYVPAGEVAHSRNIPAEKREDFAKAVEAKAGIEFAG